MMESLPEELLLKILCNLCPYREYDIASSVCVRWRRLIDELQRNQLRHLEEDMLQGDIEWYKICHSRCNVTIAPREEIAACYNDHTRSVYVFGGKCTSNNNNNEDYVNPLQHPLQQQTVTGFNDLLQFDMHTYIWGRPAVNGEIPTPKHSCLFYSYKNLLILYGGLHFRSVHNSLWQRSPRISQDLHTYNVDNKKWTLHAHLPGEFPPPMYPVSGCLLTSDPDLEMDALVVLGHCTKSGMKKFWSLDLHTFQWFQQQVSLFHIQYN